jgi:hypothetical protein
MQEAQSRRLNLQWSCCAEKLGWYGDNQGPTPRQHNCGGGQDDLVTPPDLQASTAAVKASVEGMLNNKTPVVNTTVMVAKNVLTPQSYYLKEKEREVWKEENMRRYAS